MAFELPKLPYAYDALEPHIDARTMEIHHSTHHNAYVTNLNAAIAGTDMEGKTIENILINLVTRMADFEFIPAPSVKKIAQPPEANGAISTI